MSKYNIYNIYSDYYYDSIVYDFNNHICTKDGQYMLHKIINNLEFTVTTDYSYWMDLPLEFRNLMNNTTDSIIFKLCMQILQSDMIPVLVKWDIGSRKLWNSFYKLPKNIIVSKEHDTEFETYKYEIAYAHWDWGEFNNIRDMIFSDDNEMNALGLELLKNILENGDINI